MKNFSCGCGAAVYFENSHCVTCQSELGWCPSCNTLRSIFADGAGHYRCGDASCGKILVKCHNYQDMNVCNRCVLLEDSSGEMTLCSYCRFNDTVPDLTVAGNHEKWHRIEVAKRRLLYTLDLLRLPYGSAEDWFPVPLSFDFKGDIKAKRTLWFFMNKEEQVYTGHFNGKVTINIREADHVEREKARVSFGEAHRTVIGHFRHEMGHYFWDVLVKGQCEAECVALFGDHNNPDYGTAMETYYQNGAKENWQASYISGYATMHPWEDFAESFAAYLHMISVIDIAFHADSLFSVEPTSASFKELADQHTKLGLLLNEMNRAMGLQDLVPVVYTKGSLAKIEFIHNLLRNAAGRVYDKIAPPPAS